MAVIRPCYAVTGRDHSMLEVGHEPSGGFGTPERDRWRPVKCNPRNAIIATAFQVSHRSCFRASASGIASDGTILRLVIGMSPDLDSDWVRSVFTGSPQ
jgi:hypothetical protein